MTAIQTAGARQTFPSHPSEIRSLLMARGRKSPSRASVVGIHTATIKTTSSSRLTSHGSVPLDEAFPNATLVEE